MPTILFLHGWGGNADSFAPISRYFARDYRVLMPSFPCPPTQIYTLDDYADDLARYLQQNQVTQCYVVAHSFGARVLAVLNARQPGLFTKMVVTGGAGLRPRFNLAVWLKIKFYRWRKKIWGHAPGGSPEYRQLSSAGKATFRNVVNRDLTPEIKQIKVPLLLITGSQDRATPPSMMRRWAGLVPGATQIVYRGYGHFAYLDCAARFIKDVAEFFQ